MGAGCGGGRGMIFNPPLFSLFLMQRLEEGERFQQSRGRGREDYKDLKGSSLLTPDIALVIFYSCTDLGLGFRAQDMVS